MEKERIQLEKNSRTIQQRNAGSANIMDNRPDGSRNYLSGHPLQRVEDDEEEDVLQGKLSAPVQRVESEEDDDEVLQGKMAEPVPKNETGLPDNLKAGVESLSGYSLDDVRVHYNSSKPATVQALAYTQGTDIHVAQQMAGRVSPTTNINGMPVNDNAALEHEADVMGEKAVSQRKKSGETVRTKACEPVVSQLGGGGEYYNGSYLKAKFPTNTIEIDEAIERVIDDTWDDICYLYMINGPGFNTGMIKALLEEKYTDVPVADEMSIHIRRVKEKHMKESFKRILMLQNIYDFTAGRYEDNDLNYDWGINYGLLRSLMDVRVPDGESMEMNLIEGVVENGPAFLDEVEIVPTTLDAFLYTGLNADLIDEVDKKWIVSHGLRGTDGETDKIFGRVVYHSTRPGVNRAVFWIEEGGIMKVIACGRHGIDNSHYEFHVWISTMIPKYYNRKDPALKEAPATPSAATPSSETTRVETSSSGPRKKGAKK